MRTVDRRLRAQGGTGARAVGQLLAALGAHFSNSYRLTWISTASKSPFPPAITSSVPSGGAGADSETTALQNPVRTRGSKPAGHPRDSGTSPGRPRRGRPGRRATAMPARQAKGEGESGESATGLDSCPPTTLAKTSTLNSNKPRRSSDGDAAAPAALLAGPCRRREFASALYETQRLQLDEDRPWPLGCSGTTTRLSMPGRRSARASRSDQRRPGPRSVISSTPRLSVAPYRCFTADSRRARGAAHLRR